MLNTYRHPNTLEHVYIQYLYIAETAVQVVTLYVKYEKISGCFLVERLILEIISI